MSEIETQREAYYKKLGTPPGIPTMKGNNADPENTGVGYNSVLGELGDHSVPYGWPQTPNFSKPNTPPGPPVQWNTPTNPEEIAAGYGYVPSEATSTEDIFFYHSDHLGSTSYITDREANITQFDAYLPYGELLVDEHSSSEEMPYKFNGKELDEETGLYYYGARYHDPKAGLWLSVDPFTADYSSLSGYSYCANNPINIVDVKGERILLVNGYWIGGIPGKIIGSDAPKVGYWGKGFADAARRFFHDSSVIYIDGSSKEVVI